MENKKLYPPPPSYADLGDSPTAPPPEEPMQLNSPPPPNPYQYQQIQESPAPNPYQYQQMVQSPPPPTVIQPQTVVHHNTVVMNAPTGPGMTCPHCHARVRVTVERHATCNTWLLAGLLCLCFCWPCVCLPCCCNWCYRTSQYCPNCKACLGSF
ncbi:uncharacterized protein Dwil_GK21441 [Drosophila willistoni]|uniref:GK21441 n=1 Tax=Drosophila willistoni TaxID=7260 RepID=B4MQC9_DROWI|nr:lipopolysaccharide-induced tumor necrosis factor-alpha factor [Drosophila willistoni]EDW74318.1 uncharacterized protein Dwil_GK21441 [Drosophila willistoni]